MWYPQKCNFALLWCRITLFSTTFLSSILKTWLKVPSQQAIQSGKPKLTSVPFCRPKGSIKPWVVKFWLNENLVSSIFLGGLLKGIDISHPELLEKISLRIVTVESSDGLSSNSIKREALISLMILNEHSDRIVSSTYFDNDKLSMFHHSEEGIVPRKKLRLRSYSKNAHETTDTLLEKKITSPEGRFKVSGPTESAKK